MGGERDLATLLRTLAPILDPQAYVFCALPPEYSPEYSPGHSPEHPLPVMPKGLFQEAEGITLILTPAAAEELGQPPQPWWACLSLQVHSDLTAVGLLAAITQALAQAGIPVNAISAYYHDHLFVPWEQRHLALGILEGLRAEGQ